MNEKEEYQDLEIDVDLDAPNDWPLLMLAGFFALFAMYGMVDFVRMIFEAVTK